VIEYRRTHATPTTLHERLTELSARGWTNQPATLLTRDEKGRADLYAIDSTRDSTLYAETTAGAIHRDDLFFRLARLDPASRGALLGYIVTLERALGITETRRDVPAAPLVPAAPAAPATAPKSAAAVAPEPTGDELAAAAAAATGGVVAPSDSEAAAATSEPAPANRAGFIPCNLCNATGGVAVGLIEGESEGDDVTSCPACGGSGTISARVGGSIVADPDVWIARAIEAVDRRRSKRKAAAGKAADEGKGAAASA
jgi:hypothetical protein